MPAPRLARALGVAACLSLFAPAAAKADPIVVSSGEIDLSAEYDGTSLGLAWHDEANGVEYELGAVRIAFNPAAVVPRPAGSQFGFLGVAAGRPVWVLPQVENPLLVFPGIATEEIDPALIPNGLTLELLAVRGPGDFSVWETDPFGNPNVLMASFGGAGPTTIPLPPDSHAHYNWGLSAAGLYEIDFRISGAVDGRFLSGEGTVLLEAQQVQAVPGPASVLVLGLAAVPLLARRRGARR